MKLIVALAAAFAAAALSGQALAGSAEDIIAKEKCHKCHKEKDSKRAPAWSTVAAKYKGNAEAATILFNGLKKGGKMGDEEEHAKVEASDADIKAIVEIVLSSK